MHVPGSVREPNFEVNPTPMRTSALFLLAIIVTATITFGFTQQSEPQQMLVVRYAETFGLSARKSIMIVKPEGTLEIIDLEQGNTEEKMGARLARLQQTLSKYLNEGWRLNTSVSNNGASGSSPGWYQDHFLVK